MLTLVQTGKSRMQPILLFGREFWNRLIDFDLLIETGMISPERRHLFHFVETAEEAWAVWLAAATTARQPPPASSRSTSEPRAA